MDSHDREWCKGKIFELFLQRNFIPTASLVMVRKSCFARVGYFNETLAIVDDYEFYIKIAYCYMIDYVDESLVHWRMHGSNTSADKVKLLSNNILMYKALLKSPIIMSHQRSVVKQMVLKNYFALGYHFLSSYEFKSARSYFLKSIRYKPSAAFLYFVSSYLPISVFVQLREIKRRL